MITLSSLTMLMMIGTWSFQGSDCETNIRVPFLYEKGRTMDSLLNIQSIVGELRNVYQNDLPIFTYYDTDIQKDFSTFHAPVDLVSIDEPWKLCTKNESATNNDKFQYYSGEIGNIYAENYEKALRIFKKQRKPKDYSVNIWIGEKSVHVTPHYDGVHNIFIQHFGIKTVLLAPISDGESANMIGKLHPLARQSRWQTLDDSFHEIVAPRYSLIHHNSSNQKVENNPSTPVTRSTMSVTLHPGDILYIPPYWLHETIADTCSVSLSVWWDPGEASIVSKLLEFPLPLESEYDIEEFQAAGISFLAHFLKSVSHLTMEHLSPHSNPKISIFTLRNLLFNRYYEDFILYSPSVSFNGIRFLDDEKIIRYATNTARYVVFRTIEAINADSFKATDRILGTDPSKWQRVPFSSSSPVEDDQLKEENDVSIVYLKALDYVEEVSMFLADHRLSIVTDQTPTKAEKTSQAVRILCEIHSLLIFLMDQETLSSRTEL